MVISKKPVNFIVATFAAFVSSIALANPTTDSVDVKKEVSHEVHTTAHEGHEATAEGAHGAAA